MDTTKSHRILKCRGVDCTEVEDLVAEEKRLRISINGREVLNLYCTPIQVRELAVGLILTEGIADEVCMERMTIAYGDEEVAVEVHAEGEVRAGGGTITSGCVGGVSFRKEPGLVARKDRFAIGAAALRELFGRFQRRSELYASTGCIHSAALSDSKDIILFAEDIGRHNAVDKVIGACLLEGLPFAGTLMMASGRLSSEIVLKCARWGIPMVASRTAPTALALDIAEKGGVTVVGFVRGERLNIYTHPERVTGVRVGK